MNRITRKSSTAPSNKGKRAVLRRILLFFCLLILLYVLTGLDDRLHTVTYALTSDSIQRPVRLALIADLHACQYGEDQQILIQAIDEQKPDLVLIGGDLFDERMPDEPAKVAVHNLAPRYPTYFVTGNHDYWTLRFAELESWLQNEGVHTLSGECTTVTANGQPLTLCGIDDPEGRRYASPPTHVDEQLTAVAQGADKENYAILLAHRPEWIEDYRRHGFDLILCGHVHGGQWRVPGLINGLYAPHQGLFPRYAGGLYEFPDTTMIISRGLAKEVVRIPRLHNPPELVIIDLLPAGRSPAPRTDKVIF